MSIIIGILLGLTLISISYMLWALRNAEETFTMETETHLVVDKYGKLIESAEFKIETV